ncbi:tRNA (guanosine(46)-N7)-methyltransferase TrmB [Thermosipho ferrireducens]|uniref:tRNA (guanine-N(7)-)-methyltransferase n=1 Tax=Thermosipho ferrireducens TaxID=2571116 RepID=A0ABX7S696_9BACT|nr:tRNA (guanosine(46)-N7)-methyltransferase TrmB [Thermosipho ferrireducens]QTA37709.1 tRNA (guanosine(46)-N7)-methyltransferase TrmB [Thermosipho ferrireducens]
MKIFSKFEIKPQLEPYLPLEWKHIFENDNPLHVELGFGNGEYMEKYCQKNQSVNYIGFELSITSMIKAQKKLAKTNIKNARIILCDARFGLRELFHDNSIEHIIMNFPVPWHKKSHARRRIIVADFFRTLAAVLKVGGTFELMTDEKWYAEEAQENAFSNGNFKVYKIEKNPERRVMTRYETKWLKYGRNIYRLIIEKKSYEPVERLIGGVHEMPHSTGKINPEKFYSIVNSVFKKEKMSFVVKGIYKSLDGNAHILKVISSDDSFSQHYFLVAYPQEFDNPDSTWVIKLDSTSNPYRTPAVKWSVKKLMEVLS